MLSLPMTCAPMSALFLPDVFVLNLLLTVTVAVAWPARSACARCTAENDHMGGRRSTQKRVAHIQALLGEIGAQTQVASHLAKLVFQAFYDFFAITCLTAGVIMTVNGRHREAVIWGSLGVLLTLGWVLAKLTTKGATHAMRLLRGEWDKAPAAVVRKKPSPQPSLTAIRNSEQPRVKPRGLHGL